MSRRLSPWALKQRRAQRPRLTWPGDMGRFARTGFGAFSTRPATAPEPPLSRPSRLGLQDLKFGPGTFDLLARRFDYQVGGIDALEGLEGPVVFATSEQGVMDWPVLRSILPSRLRTQQHNVERALIRGRSVAVFSEEVVTGPGVGEFSTRAAELANQHNIPIVPVAILGTFKLNEMLRLPLRTKPRVSIRFGAPIWVRGRSIGEATALVQATVGELSARGEVSWWAGMQRVAHQAEPPLPQPRWRRLWDQTVLRPRAPLRIWGADH